MRTMVTALAMLALMGLGGVALAAPAGGQATIEIRGASSAAPGERIGVVAEGWPTNSVVTFEICGQMAIDGTADCDMATSRSAGVGTEGRTGVSLEVPEPPSPCPCVVRASSTSSTRVLTASLDIRGMPFEPVQADPARLNPADLAIEDVRVSPRGRVAEWFGWPPQRVAEITLANRGVAPASDVPVAVLYGKGGEVDRVGGESVTVSVGGREERHVEVPVSMRALSLGTYTVRIEAGDATRRVIAERETSAAPWGLFALAAATVIGLLVWWRRRRHRPADAAPSPATGPDAPAPAPEGAVPPSSAGTGPAAPTPVGAGASVAGDTWPRASEGRAPAGASDDPDDIHRPGASAPPPPPPAPPKPPPPEPSASSGGPAVPRPTGAPRAPGSDHVGWQLPTPSRTGAGARGGGSAPWVARPRHRPSRPSA